MVGAQEGRADRTKQCHEFQLATAHQKRLPLLSPVQTKQQQSIGNGNRHMLLISFFEFFTRCIEKKAWSCTWRWCPSREARHAKEQRPLPCTRSWRRSAPSSVLQTLAWSSWRTPRRSSSKSWPRKSERRGAVVCSGVALVLVVVGVDIAVAGCSDCRFGVLSSIIQKTSRLLLTTYPILTAAEYEYFASERVCY